MPDVYDKMAAIAGEAAGLKPEQYPGFAHILRQTAAEERETCAQIADACGGSADDMEQSAELSGLSPELRVAVAAAVQRTAQNIAAAIRSGTRKNPEG